MNHFICWLDFVKRGDMQKFIILLFVVIYSKVTINGLGNDISNTQDPDLAKDKNITQDMSYKSLEKKLKHFINLDKNLTNLTLLQINSLIWWAQQALNSLKGYQLKVYHKTVMSSNCMMPLAPTNGGLVCAYFDSVYYCKPMCDQGYDFSFLRRSRLYETCGHQTGFSWTSQYLGGNRLAECIASDIAISGNSSAYFKEKKCQEVLRLGTEKTYIDEFIKELKDKHLTNNHKKDLDILVCG